MRAIVLCCLTCILAASEAEPSLVETVPKGVTPEAVQRELVLAYARMVYSCRVEYDASGSVRSLQLSNHGVNLPKDPEQRSRFEAERPGVDDAAIARLAELPRLEAIRLVHQNNFSDAALAVLERLPQLKVFCIEGFVGSNSADFMLHLDHLQELRWLELKHLFGLKATRVHELKGFPELLRLELDNASAQAECIPLLERCPKLRDFELHRTQLGNDEIARLCAAIPLIERFDLKQNNAAQLDARCLAAVAALEHLRLFVFNRWDERQIFWEDGVEHLLRAPALETVGGAREHPAIQRLFAERPELAPQEGRGYAVDFDYAAIAGN